MTFWRFRQISCFAILFRRFFVSDYVFHAIRIFGSFSFVEVLNRAKISDDSCVDLGRFAASRAVEVFAGNVSVVITYGEGRSERDIWKFVIFKYLADQILRCFRIFDSFAEI